MKIKIDKVLVLMNEKYYGNYHRFARELSVHPAHLHIVLTHGIGGGRKVIGALMKYCKENGLNYEEYVEL